MRHVISSCLLALLVLLASACGTASSPDTPGTLPVVRYVNFKVYDPVYVAIERGYFAERGIQVEIVGDVLGGPTAIQAVAGGTSAHAGLASLPALINANASGLPVIGVCDIQSAIGEQALEEYFVRADSELQRVEDLRGHTFAVNLWRSSFHYTALMALEQAGVPEEEVTFVLLPFDAQAPALAAGQVDVIGLMEPYASMARATYGSEFRLLFNALDVFEARQFTTHFVNREWAEANPQQARAFVDGVVDAIEWIEAHPEEAKPIVARATGIDEAHIPAYHFQPQGQVVMDDVRFWIDYMVARGDVPAEAAPAPEDIATNRYNSRITPSPSR